MKSASSKLKDPSKKGFNGKVEPSSFQALQHWDVFVVPGKFTLLDWYWLLEDEEDDISGIQASSEITSDLFLGCLLVNVKQNLIPYVTEVIKDEILETFQLVDMQTDCREPSYEDRIKTVDAFEPVPLQPDNLGPGWQQELAPLDRLNKGLSETDSQSPIHMQTPHVPEIPETPVHEDSSSRRSSTRSKRMMSFVSHANQQKPTESSSQTKRPRSKTLFGVALKKARTSKQTMRKKTSEFLDKTESSKVSGQQSEHRKSSMILDSVGSEHVPAKSLPSFRISSPEMLLSASTNAPPSGNWLPQARKISLMLDTMKAPQTFRAFDHLEPANFPATRIKPTYVIKDLEVSKDIIKPQGIRARGPVLARKETDAATSTEPPQVPAPPLLNVGNILVMPDLLGLINLSPGVTIQPDGRQSRLGSPDKVASGGLERQFDESMLKVLKQEKAHPKIMVWQLLERPTSRSLPLRSEFKQS